jgi:hypothetical protein
MKFSEPVTKNEQIGIREVIRCWSLGVMGNRRA